MPKRLIVVLVCVLSLALCSFAASKADKSSSGAPDKAYMQKIWDAWCTLDPANAAQFYAGGERTFFDIAPLKYNSWQEYQEGAKNILAGYKSATCTVNDDAAVHSHGDLAWGTATVKYEMTQKSGKVEMGNFRWTVIWEKQGGKWLTVHEHVSEPMQ